MDRRRTQGLFLVAAAAAAYSTAGYFTRLIQLDVWTILFWRGLFAGLFIVLCFIAMEGVNARRAFFAIGWPGLAVTLCSAIATVLFINAFRLTSVADVVILFAAAPFATAAIDRMVYGLREPPETLLLSGVAVLGVIIMMAGAGISGHLLGDLLALVTTLLMAGMMVIVRAHRQTPMLPAAALSAFLCAGIAAPFAAPWPITYHNIWLLAAFGVTQFGLGLVLLTLGTRLVRATESALINAIEVPMAVFWVWLAFGEIPSMNSIVGGLIVLAAVVVHTLRPAAAQQPA